MRKLLIILLFVPFFCSSQITITNIACGEYLTSYLTSEGKVYATSLNGSTYEMTYMGRTNVASMYGGQYATIVLDNSGTVAILNSNAGTTGIPTFTEIPVDTLGAAFNANTQVYALWQGYMTLRNNRVYYWGIGDPLGQNATISTTKPRALTAIPGGRIITKMAPYAGQSFPGGELAVLCSDGTVWLYSPGFTTPVQQLVTNAIDVTAMGVGVIVIETLNAGVYNLLAYGYLASYIGLTDLLGTPTSVKTSFTDIGMAFPLKKMVCSYNTLHIIDANDNHYTIGDNPVGECGSSGEYSPWRTQSPDPWNYNVIIKQTPFQNTPVQIPGKWSNIFSSVSYTFYCYGKDMSNGIYCWGRNKAQSLPVPISGISYTYSSAIQASYSAASVFPGPMKVDVLNTVWVTLNTFNLSSAKPPIACPGIDQNLTDSIATTLYGSGSSQQEGTITDYLWEVVSGSGEITNPTYVNTRVTGLSGTSVFKLTVTGRNGVQVSRNITVATTATNPVYLRTKNRYYSN